MDISVVSTEPSYRYAFRDFLILQHQDGVIEVKERNSTVNKFQMPRMHFILPLETEQDEVILTGSYRDPGLNYMTKTIFGEDRSLRFYYQFPMPYALFRNTYIVNESSYVRPKVIEMNKYEIRGNGFNCRYLLVWTLDWDHICARKEDNTLDVLRFNDSTRSFQTVISSEGWNNTLKVVKWGGSLIIMEDLKAFAIPMAYSVPKQEAIHLDFGDNIHDICVYQDLLCTLQLPKSESAIISLWRGQNDCCAKLSLNIPAACEGPVLSTYWDKLLLVLQKKTYFLQHQVRCQMLGDTTAIIMQLSTWSTERLLWIGWIKKEKECPFAGLPKEMIKLMIEHTRKVLCAGNPPRFKRKREDQ